MKEIVYISLQTLFSFYIAMFVFMGIFYFIFKFGSIGFSLSRTLKKMGLIVSSRENIFYLRQAVSIMIFLGFFGATIYLTLFKEFHLYYKLAILFSIPYSLYLAFSYVYTRDVYTETIKDYFRLNKKFINNEVLVLKIEKANLKELLNNYSGTPNQKVEKYIKSIV